MRMLLTAVFVLAASTSFGADEPKKEPEITPLNAYELPQGFDLRSKEVSEPLKNGNTVVIYSESHAEIIRMRKDGTMVSFMMLHLEENKRQFWLSMTKFGAKPADDLIYVMLKGLLDINPKDGNTLVRLSGEQAGAHTLESPPEGYTPERLTNSYLSLLKMVYQELDVERVWTATKPMMEKAKEDATAAKKQQEQKDKESTEGALRLLKEAEENEQLQQKLEEEGKLLEKIFRDMFNDNPEEETTPPAK